MRFFTSHGKKAPRALLSRASVPWTFLFVDKAFIKSLPDHARNYGSKNTRASYFTITTARSVAEAEQCAAATPPKVVITDLGLPGYSGYDLLKSLRKMEALRQTCFIAFSGDTDGEKKAQAFQAGFDHFISKPPDFEAFSDMLQGCLGRETDDQAMAAS